jgi:hypothetical protein
MLEENFARTTYIHNSPHVYEYTKLSLTMTNKTTAKNTDLLFWNNGPGSLVGIATELRAGRSGDRIPLGARFLAHVQTGPGAQPASCTMDTWSFPGVKRPGRGANPLLVPRLRIGRTIPLPPLHGHETSNRVNFTLLSFWNTLYSYINIFAAHNLNFNLVWYPDAKFFSYKWEYNIII